MCQSYFHACACVCVRLCFGHASLHSSWNICVFCTFHKNTKTQSKIEIINYVSKLKVNQNWNVCGMTFYPDSITNRIWFSIWKADCRWNKHKRTYFHFSIAFGYRMNLTKAVVNGVNATATTAAATVVVVDIDIVSSISLSRRVISISIQSSFEWTRKCLHELELFQWDCFAKQQKKALKFSR